MLLLGLAVLLGGAELGVLLPLGGAVLDGVDGVALAVVDGAGLFDAAGSLAAGLVDGLVSEPVGGAVCSLGIVGAWIGVALAVPEKPTTATLRATAVASPIRADFRMGVQSEGAIPRRAGEMIAY